MNSFMVGSIRRPVRNLAAHRQSRHHLDHAGAGPCSSRIELVAAAAEAIIAYVRLTGKELWRTKGLESNAVPTPVVWNDLSWSPPGRRTRLPSPSRPVQRRCDWLSSASLDLQ